MNVNRIRSNTYEYDKAGNRTNKGKGSAQTAYTYNGLDITGTWGM